MKDLSNLSGLDEIIRRAVAVKINIIEQDPYEGGLRAALNLGHTIGHAVEAVSNYHIKHGQAVAIGIVAEAKLAEAIGLAEPGLADKIASVLSGLGLPTRIPIIWIVKPSSRRCKWIKSALAGRYGLRCHCGLGRCASALKFLICVTGFLLYDCHSSCGEAPNA